MIVTTAQLYKIAYGKPGKIFIQEYANFIAHKNEKLGSAGQLHAVRASLKK
jgi:fructose-bisphosphate aldolase class II